MQSNPPALVLLVGPTAVGKTELAIQLAIKINGEIVSADSRLFYRGMDIGTAKPSREELARAPHHLVDIANPDEVISLALFQQKARDVISDIHLRNKLPFLVGGTGQYIRAVTQGWVPPEVTPNEKLRDELEKLAFPREHRDDVSKAEGMKEERGANWLHARLDKLDPHAAASIDARNVRRTIRALEVILTTGQKFSEQRGQGQSPYPLIIAIGLTRAREELYQRVDARIEAMFANGFIDEVNGLLEKGYPPTLPSMSAIGYRECIRVVTGELTVEQAKVEIRRATRVFVRKQANWFKKSDPQIKWFNAQSGIQSEIESYIQQKIASGI